MYYNIEVILVLGLGKRGKTAWTDVTIYSSCWSPFGQNLTKL